MSKKYNNNEIRELYDWYVVRSAKTHRREVKNPTEFLMELEKVVYREKQEMGMAGVILGLLFGFVLAAVVGAVARL